MSLIGGKEITHPGRFVPATLFPLPRLCAIHVDAFVENAYHLQPMNKHISSDRAAGVPGQPSGRQTADKRCRLTSTELLGTAREIIIEHAGSEYRLRITSNDKLILTK